MWIVEEVLVGETRQHIVVDRAEAASSSFVFCHILHSTHYYYYSLFPPFGTSILQHHRNGAYNEGSYIEHRHSNS